MTRARIDHLVVAAASLDEADRWSLDALATPAGPGGEHGFMGTHNRLLRVATVDHPRAYLEVIARNRSAPGPAAGQARWFDLDQPALQERLRTAGPRLVHWVAQVPDIRAAVAALQALGIDRGSVVEASRMTPRGPLRWQITVRPDGQRLFDGCLPTLIEWGEVHPAATLPESGVTLHGLAVRHPQAGLLRSAFDAIGLEGIAVEPGPANLCASLRTPRGALRLESEGL